MNPPQRDGKREKGKPMNGLFSSSLKTKLTWLLAAAAILPVTLAGSVAAAAEAAIQIAASSHQQLTGMDQVAMAMENIKCEP